MAQRTRSAEERVLSFEVADKAYAVPATGVREVVRGPLLTRVPQGPASLAGLMNFHGTAIPVVDMVAVLGGARSPRSGGARVIVFGEDPPVGLLVDMVIGLEVAASGRRAAKRLDIAGLLAGSFPVGAAVKTRIAGVENPVGRTVAAEQTLSFLGFRVGTQRYALPLEAVTEAMSMPDGLALLPRADETVVGMLDWRGQVLPLISLAALLGLGQSTGRRTILVARLQDALVGLVCGPIEGVLRVPISAVEAVPTILQRGEGDAEIDAIARVDGTSSLVSILSPKKLFGNREVERVIGGGGTKAVEMQVENTMVSTLPLVVFRLGEEVFGLPLGAVEEIVQLPETLTRVPRAPTFVAGVMNLRGRAVPVIDLRQRFQSAADTGTIRPRVIIVSTEQLQAGFVVDAVSEILRVDESAIAPAPAMPGDGTRVFDRVTPSKDGGAMILIVDPKELLDRAERDLLAKFKPAQGSPVPT